MILIPIYNLIKTIQKKIFTTNSLIYGFIRNFTYMPGFLAPRDVNQSLFEQVAHRKYFPYEMMNHFVDLAEGKRFEDMSYDVMAN